MAYFVFLLLYLTTSASSQFCEDCVKVNTTCYTVTHLFDLQANFRTKVVIHKMAVLHSENILFYSYEPEIEDPEYYKVAYVSLDDTKNFGIVTDENVPGHNFGTLDIDQDNSTVYLGGRDGIFTYGTSKKVYWFSSLGDEILVLYFKTHLYIVKANDTRIIVKKGDTFNRVLEYTPIKNFVIDKDNVVVFLSTNGLLLHKKSDTVLISKNAFFRGLTIDLQGDVYTWWVDGIYKVDIKKNLSDSRVVRVADMPNIGAITFDNENNILFTSDKALNKMSVSNVTEC